MSPEALNIPQPPKNEHDSESGILARRFQELSHTHERGVFDELERDLLNAHYTVATPVEVTAIFNDHKLICRSEAFNRVMDLILTDDSILITNKGRANMCIMAGGVGFRTAMQEGFSGKDVGGVVKTVITFMSDHLTTRTNVPTDDGLWDTKPDTAKISLVGGGKITSDDVAMVSFRFPIQYFPESMLTSAERDLLEESSIQFIVRHYIHHTEKTVQ
jgi:hypothetical protein